MRRRAALAVLIILLAVAGWLVVGQYTRAASLIVFGAELGGWPLALARLHERPVEERDVTIPARQGDLRARVYRPAGGTRRTLVLITGVHPAGIDDPRLMHFARSMAAVGLGVITPELPRLLAFEIAPDATDTIEEITLWASAQEDFGSDGRVGLAGISFSGGLAVVAAGRPSLGDRVAFVLSVGGHGDLLRTLETLARGVLQDESDVTVDPFGLAIVLTAMADRVVPPAQVSALREWGRTYLEAAHLPLDDPARGVAFSRSGRRAAALPEPAATFVEHVLAADVGALRPHLIEHVHEFAEHPALSPERAPPPPAPVYLLHGIGDEVIPPLESQHLARYLAPHTRVRLLLTPVLAHADLVEDPAARDVVDLVTFFASLLRQ